MRLSENRLIAWIVLALAVVFSVSFSGGGAMKNMRFETQQIFYEGAAKDGLSINRDLDARADEAYKLVTIAEKYPGINQGILEDAALAYQELTQAEDLNGRHAANTHLTRAIETLYTAIDQQRLSERDRTDAYSAYKEIQSRADTISRDTYNNRAREFNESISKFPANILAGFTGVETLQYFE